VKRWSHTLGLCGKYCNQTATIFCFILMFWLNCIVERNSWGYLNVCLLSLPLNWSGFSLLIFLVGWGRRWIDRTKGLLFLSFKDSGVRVVLCRLKLSWRQRTFWNGGAVLFLALMCSLVVPSLQSFFPLWTTRASSVQKVASTLPGADGLCW